MKTIFCYTTRASLNLVCQLSTVEILYPANWPYPVQKAQCSTIDEIKQFIEDSQAKLVNFAYRAPGVPNRPVDVSDMEKLNKAFKAYEKSLNKFG